MQETTNIRQKKMLDKKTFAIGALSLSAVVLFAANILKPHLAEANFVVKDNEYTAVTARIANGSEALYVLDNRTGGLVVLTYDPARRAVVPVTKVRPIMDAFGAMAPPPAAGGAGYPPRRK